MSDHLDAGDRLEQGVTALSRTASEIAEEAVVAFRAGNLAAARRECGFLLSTPNPALEAMDKGIWVATHLDGTGLAADLAHRAAGMAPQDASRQRTAASLFAGCRRFDEALVHAKAATALVPEDTDCAFLLAAIWNEVGHHAEATQTLLKVVKRRADFAEAFYHLAYASSKLGFKQHAANLAAHAASLDPDNTHRAIFAAHLIAQMGRIEDACASLQLIVTGGHADAPLLRTLSAFLLQIGREDEALDAIDGALRFAPDAPEYLVHRATILSRLGRNDEAVLCLDKALADDPDNLAALRHAVTVYSESGRINQAISTTAELLRRVPGNDEYSSCMMHVLSLRAEAALELPDLTKLKQRAAPRLPKERPTFGRALKKQGSIISALLLREMRTRFGQSRLGYIWVLAEMIIHLGFLAVIFQFVMHGQPPMGQSFFFFYFTGLTPYLLFLHTSEHAGSAIVQNVHMLQLPMVTHVDVVIARALLELFTQVVVTLIFGLGFFAAGVDIVPIDPAQAAAALLAAWGLGLGCGFINAVMNGFFHFWHHVFSVVIRFLYFCSGIFYVPGAMPVYIRDVLALNPLLHCVDWLRESFFREYHPQWLDRGYPVLFGLCLLLAGLLLEKIFRRQLRQPK